MISEPARKVPRRYNGISGEHPSLKNGRTVAFESLLERDYMLLLEFEPDVIRFVEQPVTFPYQIPARDGKRPRKSRYTPDILIYYRPESGRKPDLVEMKPADELIRLHDENKPKFDAAVLYAGEQGFNFVIRSEQDVPKNVISNANDLYPSLLTPANTDLEREILEFLAKVGECNGRQIYAEFSEENDISAVFRRMIAHKSVRVDWDQLIDLHSRFSIPR